MPTPVKFSAKVTEIALHADDLRSFWLTPARSAPLFQPGQFLHLALDPWEPGLHWPDSRVFSIASSPHQRDRLRVTVSRQGAFTTRMFHELKLGSQVWIKMPYGAFCPNPNLPDRAVFLAGGTGVTPFISFLEWAALERPHLEMDLHYGARTPSLLIYRDLVEQCQSRRLTAFRAYLYAEHMTTSDSPTIVNDRLSARRAWDCLTEPSRGRFYLSGPRLMIETFRDELLTLGARADAVLSDAWG